MSSGRMYRRYGHKTILMLYVCIATVTLFLGFALGVLLAIWFN